MYHYQKHCYRSSVWPELLTCNEVVVSSNLTGSSMTDATPDQRYATFEQFQRDFFQHFEAKLGKKAEITTIKAWFELGMLYQEMELSNDNDEVAAAKLANAAVKMLL